MRLSKTGGKAVGLATILVAGLAMWKLGQPAGGSTPRSERDASVSTSRSIEPASSDDLPRTEPVAAATQTRLPQDALVALVVARLREWEDQDDSKLRPQRLQELAALIDGTNLLEIVQELPADLTGYAFALPALRQKLMADPKAALAWMSAHTNISETHLLTLLHDWEQTSPDEMRQQLASLPEGEWKQKVMATASDEALSSNPAEAAVWAARMNPGEQQAGRLEMAATDWVKRDPEAAAQWVGQVSDPGLREQLAGALAVGFADIDPAQAAESAVQSIPPGAVLNRSVAEIAWTWAMQEPSSATTWVAQFPEGPARQMALNNVLGIWGNRDRIGALD